MKIGFVLDDLSASQVSYTCIRNVNKWLKNNVSPDILIFYKNLSLPCTPAKCGLFDIVHTIGFDGYLVATSLSTAKIIKNVHTAKKYYYINNIDWIRDKATYDYIIADEDITPIVRCEDYSKETGHQLIVRNFDISEMLKVL